VALVALGAAQLAAAADEARLFAFERRCMGTGFEIRVWAEDEARVEAEVGAAVERAWALAEDLNAVFSDYLRGSEVNELVKHAGEGPRAVSDEMLELLREAERIHQLSDGAFDIALRPLQRLWDLSRRDARLPSEERLAEARRRSGQEHLVIGADGSVELKRSGMRLDFGGIAKGRAADRMLALLREAGFPRALVAAGGDLAIGEAPPGEDGWRVGLTSLASPRAPDRFLRLANVGVSTSGDAHQFARIDGVRYSHILDPATGLGLTRRRSVTVVAPSATRSDALATALSVAGPEAAWVAGLPPELSLRQVEIDGGCVVERLRGAAFAPAKLAKSPPGR